MKTTFTTKLLGIGNNTGIEVPQSSIDALGAGKKPPVQVQINDYQYSSTVAVMAGKYMISFSSAHRQASGIKAGDEITVTLELETAPRVIDVPLDLANALAQAGTRAKFDALAPSKRKAFVVQLEESKSAETRTRRLEKILAALV